MNSETKPWRYWTQPEIVQVDGREVAVRRSGAGEPLLFLHGAGLTRQWLPFYDKLSERFELIVPEHPGYGDSPASPEMASIDDLVLHYDALLRTLNVERPHVLGHSLGGWIAASLATHYPDRFRSLTLLSPMGVRTSPGAVADPFRWTPEDAADILLNGYSERYEEYFVQEGATDDFVREYSENVWFARWTWNPRYDTRLDWRLSRIEMPTEVIHFADDQFIPREMSERFAQLIPSARFRAFSGNGAEPTSHLAHIQYPAELAGLIAPTLESTQTAFGQP